MGHTFQARGWEDREVKVRRDELLKVLRENRQRHVDDYGRAVAGYRQTALEKIDDVMGELKAKVAALKEGQAIAAVGLSFSLPAPASHERAYDQTIRMTEMSVDDVITLTAGQFACFVMDDWDWKDDWNASTAGYIAKAAPVRGR